MEAVKHISNFKINGCVSCAARGVVLNRVGLGEVKITLLGLSNQPNNIFRKGMNTEEDLMFNNSEAPPIAVLRIFDPLLVKIDANLSKEKLSH